MLPVLAAVAAVAALAGDPRVATAELPREGGRPLPVKATWVDGTEPMPVIVFSHGMGGSRDAYGPLARAWAEAGYLVLQPTHPDSLVFRTLAEKQRFARDPASFTRDPDVLEAWDDRPAEVALVLDRLDGLGAFGIEPARIDREHVGIGGHSFGAHTAMLCGGLDLAGGAADLAEERADAVLLLSPQGTGSGITHASYAGISQPTLMVTGSKDASVRTGAGPEWRMEAWEGLTVDERWLLWLDGASHDLGGISGKRTKDTSILNAVIVATTAFWDATLRDDATARARLEAADVALPVRSRLERGSATDGEGPSGAVTTD